MILNRGLLIAGAIPLPWNNYSNRSFQRWLKCSHLAVFLGLPASASGLGPAVNRKLRVCWLFQLPKVFEESDELLPRQTGDFSCLQKKRPRSCVASSCCNVMEVMMLSKVLQNQSDIYQLGMEFNVIFESRFSVTVNDYASSSETVLWCTTGSAFVLIQFGSYMDR